MALRSSMLLGLTRGVFFGKSNLFEMDPRFGGFFIGNIICAVLHYGSTRTFRISRKSQRSNRNVGRDCCYWSLRFNRSTYPWSFLMPSGPGTYGSKKGRPPKKGAKKGGKK